MNRILFPVDGSEASLRAARGLAGILGWLNPIEVVVLNVQPEPSFLGELLPQSLRERAKSRIRAEGEHALETAHTVLREAAAVCSTTVRFGDPAMAIGHTADALGCQVIAMGSRGAGAMSSLLTGSVTTKVIHLRSHPVLVIPSAQPQTQSGYGPVQRARRVLVPVDGSAGAMASVQEVIRVASWFRDAPEIHFLAVYEGTPIDVEIAAMVAATALSEYQKRQFEAAFEPARVALSGAGITAIEHTAIGPAAEKIHASVEAHRCDLVCLGTRGTGAARNLVIGSTAAKVLHSTMVPVLIAPTSTR